FIPGYRAANAPQRSGRVEESPAETGEATEGRSKAASIARSHNGGNGQGNGNGNGNGHHDGGGDTDVVDPPRRNRPQGGTRSRKD
ncbi:hypothetical protein SB781_37095, partial [Paraburkholderia sp. SIMBA_061]